jgi:hypothetical protein
MLDVANIKTCFLVGGLGSNEYLCDYLKMKVNQYVKVTQPQEGYIPFIIEVI